MRPLAAYRRVSRQGERPDDRFRSPELQEQALERWSHATGIPIRHFPPDVDESGAHAERPVLEEIIALVEAGELGGIVVPKLDRMSRLAPRERIELFHRIESAGGVVRSATEDLDVSTPSGRFAREVFLAIARMQWEQMAEGFAEAKATAIAHGRAIKSRAPYGYRFNATHGLEIIPEQAAIVRKLFEKRAEHASRGELLAYFEDRTGRHSSRQTMAYMTRNRVYLGELHYGQETPLVNVDAHEAIVAEELFDRVQAVDRERRAAQGY